MAKTVYDILEGENMIDIHISLTEEIYSEYRAEAEEKFGGNASLMARNILRKRYNLPMPVKPKK